MQSGRRKLLKIEMLVKGLSLHIDRMDQYRARANNLRGRCNPVEGVLQQGAAQTATLFRPVDSQTRQQDNGNRIIGWHLGGDARRAVLPIHGADRQRIVSDHRPVPVNDVGLGGIRLLILQGVTSQEQIERMLAGLEGFDRMAAVQFLDLRECPDRRRKVGIAQEMKLARIRPV